MKDEHKKQLQQQQQQQQPGGSSMLENCLREWNFISDPVLARILHHLRATDQRLDGTVISSQFSDYYDVDQFI